MSSKLRPFLATLLMLAGLLGLAGGAVGQEGGTARSIELSGGITPASASYLEGQLDDAEQAGAELVIVRLDTPGGLLDSTREIVDSIIAAPFPVVVYVSPDGARAASAGLFVTQAADVAAMAPQTNIGAASPIDADGSDIDDTVLGRKITADAAAYASALAEAHGRNGDLAARMVTDAVSVDSGDALERGLVDLVEPDTEALLAALDGFRVEGPKAGVLSTDGLTLEEVEPSLVDEILAVLLDPNVSFLLLLLGVVGLTIELFSPGLIVPGVVGGLSMLAGLFGTLQLPVTAIGVVLLVLGIALLITEGFVSGGIAGTLGVVSIAAAGLLLYDTDSDAVDVSVPVVITVAVVLGGLTAFAASKAIAARSEPVHTGSEELIGAFGRVREPLTPSGLVFVHGALWRARPAEEVGADELAALAERDSRVTVTEVDGLTLEVVPGRRELPPSGSPTTVTGRSRLAGGEEERS